MDDRSGTCLGCLRTLDEIRQWSTASDADKRAVWAAIEDRIAAQFPDLTAGSTP